MRHIFDQYDQPENRLTHALVCCLAEDRKLLNRFVRRVTGKAAPKGKLHIVEQRLPNGPEVAEEPESAESLPDGWIFTEDGWALLIESKVTDALKRGQLKRHLSTAARKGFGGAKVLAIDTSPPSWSLPPKTLFISWAELYTWFHRQGPRSEWALRLCTYMEVAENRMVAERYLKEGTLTVFAGIPFNDDNPYTYHEGKRVLNLAMDDLQARSDLKKGLGVDPKGKRRGAITGSGGKGVWDFLPLKIKGKRGKSGSLPHPSLYIGRDSLNAELTIPNAISSAWRKNLMGIGEHKFRSLMDEVTRNLERALKRHRYAVPRASLYQRRYPSQKARPFQDAVLAYDLRSAFDRKRGKPRIRHQPQWLDATYKAMAEKKSNLELQVGAMFPYGKCPVVAKPKILDVMAKVWRATAPILDALGVNG